MTAYVLAMAIKRSILDQYEQVCRQAGVLPISISCAALWLFDFYRPVDDTGRRTVLCPSGIGLDDVYSQSGRACRCFAG